MELTEHQIFICETTRPAAAMGRGENVRIYFLDRERSQAEWAEIRSLGLCYLGVFGLNPEGLPECKLAPGADYLLAVKAGAEYGQRLTDKHDGDCRTWLSGLYKLEDDPRTYN